MPPVVSFVVPCHNHAHCLPRLLESIAAQSFQQTEVIIVDDGSTESCQPVVEAYSHKGMNIRLLAPKNRLHTLQARLAGVREATGEIIAFADADDMLWGTTALEEHVRLFYEHKADVVHFRSVFTDEFGVFTEYFLQADPWSSALCGKDIFTTFLAKNLEGSTIWNKLLSRKLFLTHMDAFPDAHIQRYSEDFYLNLLLLFHSQKYVGSERIGYGYQHFHNKHTDRYFHRSVALLKILAAVVPYFKAHACEEGAVQLLITRVTQQISIYTGRASIAIACDEFGVPAQDSLAQLLQDIPAVELLNVLFMGNRLNAEKLLAMVKVLQAR